MSKRYWKVNATSPMIIWSFIVLMLVSAYAPSINGPMVFDDFPNIVENPGVAINDLSFTSLKSAFFSNVTGRIKRVLPALSFGINHFMVGGFNNTFVYKATNLIIHIVNTALVFWLSLLLAPRLFNCERQRLNIPYSPVLIAAFIALVWSVHPIHMTVVAYVVQRMTSMAGTFIFLGLCLFVLGRQRYERNQPGGLLWMWLGVPGGAVLGLMCKENGALLPLYAGVIEFTLFVPSNSSGWLEKPGYDQKISGNEPQASPKKSRLIQAITTRLQAFFGDKFRRRLFYYYLFTLFLPALAALFYLFVYPGNILDGYAGRPFTLVERLLTETRVLWFYLYLLFVPDLTEMGLFHDDLPISSGLFTPWTTIFAVLCWSIVVAVAAGFRKQLPAIAFAVLWYLAGHSMESTFIPLLLIFEHRNYVPSFGMVVLFAYLSFNLAARYGRKIRLLTVCLCLGVVAGLYCATSSRAENWRTEQRFIASSAKNHPMSPSSQYLFGELLYKKVKDPARAYPYYFKAAKLKPYEAGFLISVAMVTPVNAFAALKQQSSVRFDPKYIADLLKNRPISAWGLRSLEFAGRCIRARHRTCSDHVDFVRSWMRAVRYNNLLSLEQKRHFTNQLFEIEMRYALFNDALATVTQALSEDEGFSRFYLMRSDALAALGRYSEALDVLNRAEARFARNDFKFYDNVQRLKLGVNKLAMRRK